MRLFAITSLFLISLLTSSFNAQAFQAQQAIKLSAADYAKLPFISQMAISPSGNKVAYRTTDGTLDYVIVDDHKTGERLGAVDVSKVKPTGLYFIDEDKLIMITETNTRLSGFRGRHDISTAAVYHLSKKKIHRLLSPGFGIYTGQTQLGSVVGVSPDGNYAYLPAWVEEDEYSLMRSDLNRTRKPRIHKRGTQDTIDFFVGKDGIVLARERYNNKTNKHKVEALLDDKWHVIFEKESEVITIGISGVTPDYSALVIRKSNPDTGHFAYYTMSLLDGVISAPIFTKKDRQVESLITDINRVVYGASFSGFTPNYEFFDETLNARMRGIAQALPENVVSIRDYTPDWRKIIFYMEGSESSGSYLLYQDSKLALIAGKRPNIPSTGVHNVVEYEYKARDGMVIPSLLTLPNNTEASNLPAIMFPHGGPESYDRKGFDYMAQYFANEGFAVIQPQFRGSDGFGFDHLIAGRGEWGRKMQDDLTDGVNYLVKEGLVNPKRVCIVGASYGGYAALAGAAFSPEIYKCAVSINGVSDIERMVKRDRSKYGKNHWVVSYWEKVIANGEYDEDHLEQISPINHVDKINIPVLLIHGTRDAIVDIEQSENMEDALDDADKRVEFVELPKGDHYISSADNRMRAMLAIEKFVKKHIED